jgi:hypothetical protein
LSIHFQIYLGHIYNIIMTIIHKTWLPLWEENLKKQCKFSKEYSHDQPNHKRIRSQFLQGNDPWIFSCHMFQEIERVLRGTRWLFCNLTIFWVILSTKLHFPLLAEMAKPNSWRENVLVNFTHVIKLTTTEILYLHLCKKLDVPWN